MFIKCLSNQKSVYNAQFAVLVIILFYSGCPVLMMNQVKKTSQKEEKQNYLLCIFM